MTNPIADLATWPLILCGPILRKVTTARVDVFVVCREPCQVELIVMGPGGPWTSNPIATRAIGKRMHVIVVSAAVNLVGGVLYDYDLLITPDGDGSAENLGQAQLGYAPGRLPSFCIASDLAGLRLVHGSCRLPHGDGRDMLALVDGLIGTHVDDPRERPNQLILSGDQIYADDVAPCLMTMLTELGTALLGWNETLPYGGSPQKQLSQHTPLHLGPARRKFKDLFDLKLMSTPEQRAALCDFRNRSEFLYGQTDLTSGYADCHLLFFAEYCAMYVMAWSPWPWPSSIPTAQDAVPLIRGLDGKHRKFRAEAEATREQLVRYAATLPLVRRALANVPVAMMFDDHEVTDDWNLNPWWMHKVYVNPTGRQVIRNGLLAYAVFQDWGNQSSDYQEGMGERILDALTLRPSGEPPIVQQPELVDVELGLPPATAPRTLAAPRLRKAWHHRIVGSDYQILLLDTRTWRHFPDGIQHNATPAELIELAALHRQIAPALDERGRMPILVSGTPILGVDTIESAQKVMAYNGDWTGKDFEAWTCNRAGYGHLIAALAELGVAVVLAGDVHYAYAAQAAIANRNREIRARVVQLNASAFKNYTGPTLAGQLALRFISPFDWSLEITGDEGLEAEIHTQVQRALRQRLAEAKARNEDTAPIHRALWKAQRELQLGRAPRGFFGSTTSHWWMLVKGAEVRRKAERIDDQWRVTDVGAPAKETGSILGWGNLGVVRFTIGADGKAQSVEQKLYFFIPGYGEGLPRYIDVVEAHVPLSPPTELELLAGGMPQ